MTGPATELDSRFSSTDAIATPWAEARQRLGDAEVFYLSTVRPDGRPHVTPLLAVWLDEALYFCTGPDERKARNLAQNAHCILTTGTSSLHKGPDLVVEGAARRVRDSATLRRIADEYVAKYGSEWTFDVGEDAFINQVGGVALVFEVRPGTAFGFAKGVYGQTRWRF